MFNWIENECWYQRYSLLLESSASVGVQLLVLPLLPLSGGDGLVGKPDVKLSAGGKTGGGTKKGERFIFI